jgi:hypothetical protein
MQKVSQTAAAAVATEDVAEVMCVEVDPAKADEQDKLTNAGHAFFWWAPVWAYRATAGQHAGDSP